MVQVPSTQIPGVYHRRIGDIVVTALSDGYLDGTVDVLQNITPGAIDADADRCVSPGAAHLGELLPDPFGRAAGTDRDRLGRLPAADGGQAASQPEGRRGRSSRYRNGHPDAHASRIIPPAWTNPKTGAKLFPNAELVVHENEPRHWQDDVAMSRAAERARKLYFACAREQMAPYHNVMRTYTGSVDVFPGVTSMPFHGHTPGHSGYMVSSGNHSLLIWGDIVHVPEIQVPRPEVTIEFDTDPHAAAATRRRVFDMVAADRQLIAGMHVHFPGFAHVETHGDSYALTPEPWGQAFGG